MNLLLLSYLLLCTVLTECSLQNKPYFDGKDLIPSHRTYIAI